MAGIDPTPQPYHVPETRRQRRAAARAAGQPRPAADVAAPASEDNETDLADELALMEHIARTLFHENVMLKKRLRRQEVLVGVIITICALALIAARVA